MPRLCKQRASLRASTGSPSCASERHLLRRDASTEAVLRQHADARGLFLSDEVMDYLLHRFSRDLASLMHWLDQLDRYALQTKRAITVPLVRDMMDQL